MADAMTFYRTFVTEAQATIAQMQKLEVLQQRMDADPGLDEAAAAAAAQGGRTDLQAADFMKAKDTIVQLLFTWNSGSPPQKDAFYKML